MSALLTVSPTALRFRSVYVGEQSNPLSISISNDGSTSLELDVIVPPGDEWLVDLSQVKLMLGPGEGTKVPVVFAPKSTGSKSELIDIRMKGTAVSLAQISAEGDGINRPMPMVETGGCSMATHGPQLPTLGLTMVALLLLVRRRKARSL
jgi:MYXO-CTERM domain-containing protein